MDGFTPQTKRREVGADFEDVLVDRAVRGPQPAAPAWGGGDPSFARLVRTIEGEIIPRLMLAHREAPAARDRADGRLAPGRAEVEELVRLALAHEADVASAFVSALRDQGVAVEALYLDLLAPAARRLGELWSADLADFAEVTVGLGRLQRVAHSLRGSLPEEDESPGGERRALLVAVPGEQHTFGLSLVAEFFRRAGWSVTSEPLGTVQDLLDLVRREWFAVVGLSVSAEARMAGLASVILGVRRVSCNRAVGVMVGGRIFNERPELVAQVGADATAPDGRQAVAQAQSLLELLARRS
jgi:methanogenic corrinoid protein MtbC1